MPYFEGSCGCYSRENAKRYGILGAIVLNQLIDYQYFFANDQGNDGWFYRSMSDIADHLLISYRTFRRIVAKLKDAGVIEYKSAYKPGTLEKTTYWRVVALNCNQATSEPVTVTHSAEADNMTHSIYKETKEDTHHEEVADVDNQDDNEPVMVYMRSVSPSTKQWKNEKVFTTREELDRLESLPPKEPTDFVYWKGPRLVGEEKSAKHKWLAPWRVQAEIEEDQKNTAVVGGKEVEIKYSTGIY